MSASISGGEGTVATCAECGSENVQTLHLYWVRENGAPMPEYYGRAETYPNSGIFCPDCNAEGRASSALKFRRR